MAGIYIHIPFCKQACHYCDFHFSTSLNTKEVVLSSILREIELRKNYLDNEVINTIYLGGGTPSLLSGDDLASIFEQVNKYHAVSTNAEITLEANPDDLSEEKLQMLRSTPVNRLSIGIQSFFDEDLQFMNRAHNAGEAFQSVKRAQAIGFKNITIDLIYGTPTMNNEQWQANLAKAFSLDVQHISCYCLTVEPKTALARMIDKGKAADVNENSAITQFEMLLEGMQEHGYTQYEISNFCKGNNFSKHNSNYWRKEKYMGIGPSAHSYNGTSRQWNVSNNMKYANAIKEGIVPFEKEELSIQQQYNEYILTSLRTIWGCDAAKVKTDFGSKILTRFLQAADPYIVDGSILRNDNLYTLTNKGKLMTDAIAADLFID